MAAERVEIEQQDGWLRVSGPLVFATATQAAAGASRVGDGLKGIDLAQVSECDSSALAVVVEWLRAARRAGVTLEFKNVPDNLRAIADTSELGYLFD